MIQMNHDMAQMIEPTGTFVGHFAPGLAFVFWGLCWLVAAWRTTGERDPGDPFEPFGWFGWVKVVALLIAFPLEVPGRGWSPMSFVMGWHHITIYLGLALSGAVDLLHRRGRLSRDATCYAFAGAMFTAVLIFWGHGNHGGVEATAHRFIALLFGTLALVAVKEARRPEVGLLWLRSGLMLAQGIWFNVTAWLLFRSGWNLTAVDRVAWVFPLFAWTALGVAAILVAVASFRPTLRTA